MIPTTGSMKTSAKLAIRGNSRPLLWTTLAYFCITIILSYIVMRLSGFYDAYRQFYSDFIGDLTIAARNTDVNAFYNNALSYSDLSRYIPHPSAFEVILCAAVSLMSGVIGCGYAGMCLKVSRGEQVSFRDLFSSFDNFFKFLWLIILRGILTFLWTLLLVIPGIIAAYRYSQAVLIMHDNPELTAWQCLRESSAVMSGHKLQFFVLELSFIGWYILNSIVTAVTGFGLVQLWLLPYQNVTFAVFYNILVGRPNADDVMPPL